MQRVAVVGLLAAGKTTLALALGKASGLEVLHIDGMFLRPDGGLMTAADRQAKLDSVLNKPEYIFEGAHGWTFGPRIARCDTVIWMDLGIVRRALNAFRRRSKKFQAQRVTVARLRSGVRFWGWFFLSYGEERKALLAALANRPDSVRLVHLRSLAEGQAFLDSLRH